MTTPQMNSQLRVLFVAFAIAIGTTTAMASIQVNSGFTLTETDLTQGLFNGQPFSLGPGTNFDINDGGVIGPVGNGSPDPSGAFDFLGSIVNINNGGHFESDIFTPSSVRNLSLNVFEGGTVGSKFIAAEGTDIHINGGHLGGFVNALTGSTVTMTSGSIGAEFGAFPNTSISISGGFVDRAYAASAQTVTNISGGAFGPRMRFPSASTLNLFVLDLALDGEPVPLIEDLETLISTRGGVELTATLADGTFFDLTLNNETVPGEDRISDTARLTVTRVPAPSSMLYSVAGLLVLVKRHRDHC